MPRQSRLLPLSQTFNAGDKSKKEERKRKRQSRPRSRSMTSHEKSAIADKVCLLPVAEEHIDAHSAFCGRSSNGLSSKKLLSQQGHENATTPLEGDSNRVITRRHTLLDRSTVTIDFGRGTTASGSEESAPRNFAAELCDLTTPVPIARHSVPATYSSGAFRTPVPVPGVTPSLQCGETTSSQQDVSEQTLSEGADWPFSQLSQPAADSVESLAGTSETQNEAPTLSRSTTSTSVDKQDFAFCHTPVAPAFRETAVTHTAKPQTLQEPPCPNRVYRQPPRKHNIPTRNVTDLTSFFGGVGGAGGAANATIKSKVEASESQIEEKDDGHKGFEAHKSTPELFPSEDRDIVKTACDLFPDAFVTDDNRVQSPGINPIKGVALKSDNVSVAPLQRDPKTSSQTSQTSQTSLTSMLSRVVTKRGGASREDPLHRSKEAEPVLKKPKRESNATQSGLGSDAAATLDVSEGNVADRHNSKLSKQNDPQQSNDLADLANLPDVRDKGSIAPSSSEHEQSAEQSPSQSKSQSFGQSSARLSGLLASHSKQTTITNPYALAYRHSSSHDLAEATFDPDLYIASHSTLLLTTRSTPTVVPKIATGTAHKTVKFAFLAETLDEIEKLKGSGTGSKKKATVILTNAFRVLLRAAPMDLVPAVYVCLNKVAPDYEGLEIGVGEGILVKIITELYGKSKKSITQALAECEDLGRVGEMSRGMMQQLSRPPPLSISSVFSALRGLPTLTGGKSQERKKDAIKKLLAAAVGSEPKYIIRFLQQRLRVGAQSATIYQALAYAFVLTPPNAELTGCIPDVRRDALQNGSPAELDMRCSAMEKSIKQALSEVSNVEVVVKYLMEGCDWRNLNDVCVVTPGVPVQPMLAKPTKGIQEVLDRFGTEPFSCEFKYDGERAQVHVLNGGKQIEIFSRNLETLTAKYPDLVVLIRDALRKDVVQDCIVDCEVVAYDVGLNKILPFQILSTRKRKDVEASKRRFCQSIASPFFQEVIVRVCLFPFDCIRFNATVRRREHLYNIFTEKEGSITYAKHAEMTTVDDIDSFLQEAIDANCEGLMVKTLDGTSAHYEPSKRSLNWLKVKKDYLLDLTDSVDLVPIGAFFGKGSRSKVFGTYLLACYDSEEETWQTTCKAGTGFTQEMLQELYDSLAKHLTNTKHPAYASKIIPDVWFDPVAVWEVRAADLSISPVHTAALGVKEKDRVSHKFARSCCELSTFSRIRALGSGFHDLCEFAKIKNRHKLPLRLKLVKKLLYYALAPISFENCYFRPPELSSRS